MARCAQASAGAAAGSSATSSGTSTMVDSVTVARSAAGVISIDAPARTDTCPYAVTRLRRDSTWAASTRSLRCADTRITLRSPESPGDRAQPARPRQPSTSVVRSRRHCLLRSEEHTSELQSRRDLVCRLLLEKKKKKKKGKKRIKKKKQKKEITKRKKKE